MWNINIIKGQVNYFILNKMEETLQHNRIDNILEIPAGPSNYMNELKQQLN